MTGRGVIFDLVAAQSPSYRGRGIARYSTELVRAIVRGYPELVSAVVLHPGLPMPGGLDDLRDWVTTEPDWASASVVHLSSVIEPEVPVRTYWAREASANRLLTAVTLYDLIPDMFPGWYLEDPGLRRRWRCCREVVRAADAVFTLSQAARNDAMSRLGLPARRVHVVGSGTAAAFHPPESKAAAFQVAKKGVRGLRQGFIVYNGAFNPRKNVDRLIEGYASLPRAIVDGHQLVIVCDAPPLTRNHYLVKARELGIDGRLLIPGFVGEPVLVALYQSTDLAVYPSLYEGYGLPVVESMACGAPSIAGDNSSLREILPREARFQPEDPGAIAEAIERALVDTVYRGRLLALAAREPPAWGPVADRAAAVLQQMLERAGRWRPGWRRRSRLALVGAPSELASALRPLADCDRFAAPSVDYGADEAAPPTGTGAERALSFSALARLDAWRGGYDAVVAWADELGEEELGVMEAVAAGSPGPVIALVGQAGASTGPAVPSRLANLGLDIVRVQAGSWDVAARTVAEAARGRRS
ncbi:MAG TPA: glycosyltransferase family 1 protein [Acidimicrobiales bacterium]|nr:glycosyltransferase family 1 protein [Acidimicrobiales bacterium]